MRGCETPLVLAAMIVAGAVSSSGAAGSGALLPGLPEPLVLLADPAPSGRVGANAGLVALADGYALTWFDFNANAYPGDVLFRRFDPSGQALGDPVLLNIPRSTYLDTDQLELVRSSDGFVLVSNDARDARVVGLAADGRQRGPSTVLNDAGPHTVSAASNGRQAAVTTTGFDFQYFAEVNFVYPVLADGSPTGQRFVLGPRPATWRFPFVYDSPVAPDGDRFLSAWVQTDAPASSDGRLGVRARRLNDHAQPDDMARLVAPDTECPAAAWPAATDDVQAVVYSAGCRQMDVFVRLGTGGRSFSEPYLLAGEPWSEGDPADFGGGRVLRAVALARRLGALYWDRRLGPVFVEFDLDSRHVVGRRELRAELGMNPVQFPALVADEFRGRYLVIWTNRDWVTPAGVYLVALRPAP